METKRVLIVDGSRSGSTAKVYDVFWKRKDGSAWKPDSHANSEELEEDGEWQKHYLLILEENEFMGPPQPKIVSSASVKLMEKN